MAQLSSKKNSPVVLEAAAVDEAKVNKSDGSDVARTLYSRVWKSRNDFLLMWLVLAQTIQHSFATASANLNSPAWLLSNTQGPKDTAISDNLVTNSGAVDSVGNVMINAELSDGQYSRYIILNGLRFKETSLTPQAGKSPISLWQFTNQNYFFQIIFNDGYSTLVDCERIRRRDLIDDQNRKFDKELNILLHRNQTKHGRHHEYLLPHVSEHEFQQYLLGDEMPESYKMAFADEAEFNDINRINRHDSLYYAKIESIDKLSSYDDLPKDLRELLDLKLIKSQCEAFHRQMKDIAHGLESKDDGQRTNATDSLSRRKRAISDLFLAPNTRWCGKGQAASSYTHLGGHSRADKCCRRHDHCKMIIHALSANYRLFNYRPFTISHCNCDKRKRRDLANMLIVPGTKWCGKGYLAKRYAEIGGRSKADRCCRHHDKRCPYWIEGFQKKYSLFNWRVNTLMHCKCDERFRTCLKMADSSDANLVGNLFFNIVQTQCFVLKPEKYCKQYNWLKRKCEKRGIRKRAHLRDNRRF